ncbi:MAG TPA: hydroxymethylbilane synthase [Mycobacteriales bacterium]|nr:hydroxymethylbilane synthase [Mycobacteriales bacterium]
MTATGSAVETLRLGSRRSALALAQARAVAGVLQQAGHPSELVEVVTEGDRSAAAVADFGGTGVFVTELRQRLLAGEIDLAVHSLKDLPTAPVDGIALAAVPVREDPRDALVSRDGVRLAALPAGARIGTGSPRRMAQLRALRRGYDVVPLRGNVDTRLRRLADGELHAIVVAAAGLARLNRLDEASELLTPEQMLPAPGQGALAVECRAADQDLVGVLRTALEHAPTRAIVTAERTLLAELEAGCSAPLGALAESAADQLTLHAVVADVAGQHLIRRSATGTPSAAVALGKRLAADLLAAGAAELMAPPRMIGDQA